MKEPEFLSLAMKYYDNPQCTHIGEFSDDMNKFIYLKKLLFRVKRNNDMNERLILNHIITLHNLFGIVTPDLLFYKIDEEYWDLLATFLLFLNIMPEHIPDLNVHLTDLTINTTIMEILKNQ